MAPGKLNSIFKALARHYEVGRAICDAGARGGLGVALSTVQIGTRAGITSARAFEVEQFLREGAEHGLFIQQSPTTFSPALSAEDYAALAWMFGGVELYQRHVHKDLNEVDVVISKPPAPSKFADALDRSLEGAWGMQPTSEVFPLLADQARRRFTIMTPFLDADGAERLVRLFGFTRPTVTRELIIRFKTADVPPDGLSKIWAQLQRYDVAVYDFRLFREEFGVESFHAKIVLADAEACYVGSSNLTWASFSYSLELGLFVRGRIATRARQIVDAVIEVARRVNSI
jgi:hypothetical protein